MVCDTTSDDTSTVDESNTESHVPRTSDEPYDITTAFWLLPVLEDKEEQVLILNIHIYIKKTHLIHLGFHCT